MRILGNGEFMTDQTEKPRVSDLYHIYVCNKINN